MTKHVEGRAWTVVGDFMWKLLSQKIKMQTCMSLRFPADVYL